MFGERPTQSPVVQASNAGDNNFAESGISAYHRPNC
jgi:hypothetical protein